MSYDDQPKEKQKGYSPMPIAIGVVALIAVLVMLIYSQRSTTDEANTARCSGAMNATECGECCAQSDNPYTYSQVDSKCICHVRRGSSSQ